MNTTKERIEAKKSWAPMAGVALLLGLVFGSSTEPGTQGPGRGIRWGKWSSCGFVQGAPDGPGYRSRTQ